MVYCLARWPESEVRGETPPPQSRAAVSPPRAPIGAHIARLRSRGPRFWWSERVIFCAFQMARPGGKVAVVIVVQAVALNPI